MLKFTESSAMKEKLKIGLRERKFFLAKNFFSKFPVRLLVENEVGDKNENFNLIKSIRRYTSSKNRFNGH